MVYASPSLVILADDLIWGDGCNCCAAASAGAAPSLVGSIDPVAASPDVRFVIVDLTARAYDGIAGITLRRTPAFVVLGGRPAR